MNRGRVKSIILLLLLINSLFLSSYIWFSGELWPSGYNSLVFFGENGIISNLFKKEKSNSIPMENLSKPDKIILTNGENRYVFYNTDQSFEPVFNASKKMLHDVFSDRSITVRRAEVTSEEWYSVLRNDEILDTQSIYMSYEIAFSSDLFSSVIGVFDTWIDGVAAVKDFIIAPVGTDTNEMLVYIKEYNSEVVHKFYVNYAEKHNIVGLINNTAGGEENYSYSFELNLDGSSEGLGTGIEQKVFLASDVLISPNSSQSKIIKSSNPIKENNQDLLGVFGYSAGSPRKYIDENETTHFVENYSSLLISKDGMIEYSAVGTGSGIDLLGDSGKNPTFYECLNGAIEFSEKVWKTVVPGQEYNVLVSSNLLENTASPNEYVVTLDYYFEGTRITVDKPNAKNAVEIKIKDGRITNYRHIIRSFETEGEIVTNTAMIMALDGIYNMFQDTADQIVINDIFLSYVEDGAENEKAPIWCIRVNGENNLVFYGGE